MHKLVAIILFQLIGLVSFSQNPQKGYIAEGYDVVAYHSGEVVKGNSQYESSYKGAKYKFSTQANLTKFNANKAKYAPQYGGWCAYAMAKGSKYKINPKNYRTFCHCISTPALLSS